MKEKRPMEGKCILVCAGDFTLCKIPVEENDCVIAVDAGLSYLDVLGIEPDVVLGDFDSLEDSQLGRIKHLQETVPERVVVLPCEKDDTDTMAAIKYGMNLGYREFRIYGAMGGRLDHYIANLQALLYLKHHGGNGYLQDGSGMVLLLENEEVAFPAEMEGIVSLFAMEKEVKGVTLQGLKYELEDACLTNDFPLGVSNEFVGKEALICVREGALACIITFYEE